MANINIFEEKVSTRGIEHARAGILAISEDLHKETYIFVTKVARFAEERMKVHVDEPAPGTSPRAIMARTGNLKSAVYSDKLAKPVQGTAGRFIAGSGWEARAGIRDYSIARFRGRKAVGRTDPPIEYALAVSDGRRELIRPFGKKFAWLSPGGVASPSSAKKGYGYDTFRTRLRARHGNRFIPKTQHDTELYVAAHLGDFTSRLGKSTVSTRAEDLFNLGQARKFTT